MLHEPGKNVVDVVDRKRIVRTIVPRRPFRPGTTSVPGFAGGVSITHEQHVLGLRASRDQNGNRLGLRKTGEVEEITVGPIVIENVAVAGLLRHCRQDGDAALADHFHELAAATNEFSFTHATLGELERCSMERVVISV